MTINCGFNFDSGTPSRRECRRFATECLPLSCAASDSVRPLIHGRKAKGPSCPSGNDPVAYHSACVSWRLGFPVVMSDFPARHPNCLRSEPAGPPLASRFARENTLHHTDSDPKPGTTRMTTSMKPGSSGRRHAPSALKHASRPQPTQCRLRVSPVLLYSTLLEYSTVLYSAVLYSLLYSLLIVHSHVHWER